MTRPILAAASVLAILATATPTLARPAQCEIVTDDTYKGPCDFEPFGGNGSFMLTAKGRKEILPRVSALNVNMVAPGVAVVSGENSSGAGHGYFDGAFVRSKETPACWDQKGVMTEYRVCVR